MKVLILTSSFARFPGDATAAHGNALYDLARELGEHIEATLLTHAGPGAPEREQLGGIEVRRIPPERPEAALHKAILGPDGPRVYRAASALRQAARELAPNHDLAHAYWVFPGGWAIRDLKMPRLMTLPGPDIHVFPKIPVLGAMIRRSVRSMDACVAVDPMGRDILRQLGAKRVEHIPSPIRLADFPVKPLTREPRFVYVGRLAKEKGVDVLLEALAVARRSRMDLKLEIVGDGPERSSLSSQVSSLGIADAVSFTGPLRRAEVSAAIAKARVLVLPSRREGLPSAALEALAIGRPVVASAVGGLPELLGTDKGITVPSESPGDLAAALLEASTRDWDTAILRGATEPFSVERAARAYVELYSSMLAGDGAHAR